MKIFDDCKSYINDNIFLIKSLKKKNFVLFDRFIDPLNIIEFINKKQLSKEKIDEDLITIYYQAFSYLYNCIETFKIYFKNYFNENLNTIKQYDLLLNYILYLDDLLEQTEDKNLKSFLLLESKKLETILIDKKNFSLNELDELDAKLYAHILDKNLLSSQEIFSLIAEEMGV